MKHIITLLLCFSSFCANAQITQKEGFLFGIQGITKQGHFLRIIPFTKPVGTIDDVSNIYLKIGEGQYAKASPIVMAGQTYGIWQIELPFPNENTNDFSVTLSYAEIRDQKIIWEHVQEQVIIQKEPDLSQAVMLP